MLVKQILRRKRAVSPVVSTLFLFGVILGAIAVSLGIIYPQVQTLNDEIELDTAGSTILSLNNEIRTLILNGENSKIIKTLDTGRTGYFFIENSVPVDLSLQEDLDGGWNTLQNFSLTLSRLRMRQVVDQNPIPQGDYRYILGQSSQSTIYLNNTNRGELQWPMVVQTRAEGEDFVYTSLSYRTLVGSERVIDYTTLDLNLTIELQLVNFTIGGDIEVSKTQPQITIEYKGTQTITYDWTSDLDEDVRLFSILGLDEPGDINLNEVIFFDEAPLEASSQFKVRLRFTFHQVEVII